MAKTILIVDDHDQFRSRARQLLEGEGYEVVGEAADGAEALRCVESVSPDAVLLDVHLPDISGFEIARQITSADRDAPAVVLTSTRDGDDFAELVDRCGARGFVAKAELTGAALGRLLA